MFRWARAAMGASRRAAQRLADAEPLSVGAWTGALVGGSVGRGDGCSVGPPGLKVGLNEGSMLG